MSQAVRERPRRISTLGAGAGTAIRGRATASLTKRSSTRAISNRERQATLISNNAADGPAFEGLVVPEATARYRQVVRVTNRQTMRPVEITTGLVLERIVLGVEKIAAPLAGASDIQLVRAQ